MTLFDDLFDLGDGNDLFDTEEGNLFDLGTPVAPTIISNGGGATANVNAAENQTAVTTVVATGDAPIAYAIDGGADAALFSIDEATGVLTFAEAPDYEDPQDDDTDNVYEITVTATNGEGSDSQDLSITVTDIDETPPEPGTIGLTTSQLTCNRLDFYS